MTQLSTLTTVFGTVAAIAMLPQVYLIFKRKSAKDISILTNTVRLLSGIFWVLYGLEIQNDPVIITQMIINLNLILIIIGWYLYGR